MTDLPQWKQNELHGFDLALAMAYGTLRGLDSVARLARSQRAEAEIKAKAVRDLIGRIEANRELRYGSRSDMADRITGEPAPQTSKEQ